MLWLVIIRIDWLIVRHDWTKNNICVNREQAILGDVRREDINFGIKTIGEQNLMKKSNDKRRITY